MVGDGKCRDRLARAPEPDAAQITVGGCPNAPSDDSRLSRSERRRSGNELAKLISWTCTFKSDCGVEYCESLSSSCLFSRIALLVVWLLDSVGTTIQTSSSFWRMTWGMVICHVTAQQRFRRRILTGWLKRGAGLPAVIAQPRHVLRLVIRC